MRSCPRPTLRSPLATVSHLHTARLGYGGTIPHAAELIRPVRFGGIATYKRLAEPNKLWPSHVTNKPLRYLHAKSRYPTAGGDQRLQISLCFAYGYKTAPQVRSNYDEMCHQI